MLAEKTKQLRHKTVYTVMQLLAPKLRIDLDRAIKLVCNDTPRPFTKMLKEVYGDKKLVGCEIGFGHGRNAESLLKELNIEMFYCVDPYFGSQPYMDTGVSVEWYLAEKKADFKKFMAQLWIQHPVKYVYATSDDAFKNNLVPKELDFIYIDGCHTKDYCLRDICNAMQFVKKGGFVGGHDFANGGLVGVEQAVFEYYHFTGNKPTCVYPDFWFQRRQQY